MHQVVAYKGLEIMESYGCLQEVVVHVYERFQLYGFEWENFGVFG